MKNKLNTFFIVVLVSMMFGFVAIKHEPDNATAKVSQIEGFYIFTDSKPIMHYDSLGTVGLGFITGTQYETIKSNLIKRARVKYPDADGLILELRKKGLDRAFVIKFK